MIALSIATANPAHWPGAAALLPVLGTLLVLLAQRQNSLLTAPALLQRLGDWSYSIYLWHWPVAVALVYVGWQSEAGAVLAGLVLSLVLGWLSYRWVEPLGRNRLAVWRTAPAIGVFSLMALLVAVPSLLVRLQHGIPGRLKPEVEAIAAAANDHNPLRDKSHSMGGLEFKKHVYGGPNIRAIVWGDSHASTIVTAVQAALQDPQDGVLGMSYTSCPTLLGVRQERKDLHCAEFNEWALQQMASLPAQVPVLIVNRGSAYLHGNLYGATEVNPSIYFDSTLRKLEKGWQPFLKEYADNLVGTVCQVTQSRPVILLRPLPEMPVDVPRTMARAEQLGRSLEVHMPLTLYHKRNAVAWSSQDRAAKQCGAQIVDPLPFICKNDNCQGMDEKSPRYYDDNHISEAGNKILVKAFLQITKNKH